MFPFSLVNILYNLTRGCIFVYKSVVEKWNNIKINSLNEGWELKLPSKKKPHKNPPLPSKSCLDGAPMEDIKFAVRSMACSITKKRHLCFRPWKTDSTLKHLSALVKLVHGYGGVAYKDSLKTSKESNFCVSENSERAVNHSKEQTFFCLA